jgi:hypothetical protein
MKILELIGWGPLALIVIGTLAKHQTLSVAGMLWGTWNALSGTRDVRATVTADLPPIVYPSRDRSPSEVVQESLPLLYWGSWGNLSSTPPD